MRDDRLFDHVLMKPGRLRPDRNDPLIAASNDFRVELRRKARETIEDDGGTRGGRDSRDAPAMRRQVDAQIQGNDSSGAQGRTVERGKPGWRQHRRR